MKYYPKNRIKTNLYTRGGDFINSSNGNPYVGYYYKTYNGYFFSGKDPSDPNTLELLPLSSKVIEPNFPEIFDPLAEGYNIKKDNYEYIKYLINTRNNVKFLKLKDINPETTKRIPKHYYYTPSEEDYERGIITRYFIKQINRETYIEIDKKTYNFIYNKDSEWYWEKYLPFKIDWKITGNLDMVRKHNENNVNSVSESLKLDNFKGYLKMNYSKFHK
jgi:hypothetical protein